MQNQAIKPKNIDPILPLTVIKLAEVYKFALYEFTSAFLKISLDEVDLDEMCSEQSSNLHFKYVQF